ncbi:MAG: hypothetical protein DME24_00470 [Verrucomicrobia bacterium]|nr:MAG: hypothetical protein DME24_00470 [Verrucomicrobiota bacterium]
MNDNPFNNRRPTEIEDQAHVETVRHFAEPLKQFPTSRDAVKHLERDVAKTALDVLAASQRPPQGNPLLADDGSQWHESIHLFDNIFVCHRPTANGTEYAVVEHFPANGRNEICSRGRNAVEVLKAFTHDQRQALQIWTDDMTAQVKEFLAEKYPGQDMSRVADSFIHKFTTQAVAQKESRNQQQKHSRRIGV